MSSSPADLGTSEGVLDAYIAHSWRSNALRQREKGLDFVIGRRGGPYIWNLEGTQRLLDCGTGGGVHSLGHRHPEVLEALRDALEERDTGLWSIPNREYLFLQENLAELSPTPRLTQSVITLSSTASVDLAAMCAFRMTGRSKILAYRHGYHGHAGFAAVITGSLEEGIIEHYKLPTTHSSFFERYGDVREMEEYLTSDVAAVILELMDYETFAPANVEFIDAISDLCRKKGVLLIIDETRTGLGRTGRLWASEHYSFEADMMIVGKGLSGGLYPVSALQMREQIYERCINEHRFSYISSLGGNEISCIVGLKVLEIVSRPDFLSNVCSVAHELKKHLSTVCSKRHNLISPGESLGCIATVHVPDAATARALYRAMIQNGVLCHSVSEIEPVALKFFPPLIIDTDHVQEIARALDKSVQSIG